MSEQSKSPHHYRRGFSLLVGIGAAALIIGTEAAVASEPSNAESAIIAGTGALAAELALGALMIRVGADLDQENQKRPE